MLETKILEKIIIKNKQIERNRESVDMGITQNIATVEFSVYRIRKIDNKVDTEKSVANKIVKSIC